MQSESNDTDIKENDKKSEIKENNQINNYQDNNDINCNDFTHKLKNENKESKNRAGISRMQTFNVNSANE